MTAVHLGDVVPALDNPEPSETKLGRRFGDAIDWQRVQDTAGTPSTAVAAPLDRRRFQQAPEAGYAPQWYTGSFRVPYGMTADQLEGLVKEMATRWFAEMQRRGYDLCNTVPDLIPGPNPSRDLQSGVIVPGYRDFLIRAQFVVRQPTVTRLELPGDLFEAFRPSQLPTSSGDEGD
jgi:hypothetical protein